MLQVFQCEWNQPLSYVYHQPPCYNILYLDPITLDCFHYILLLSPAFLQIVFFCFNQSLSLSLSNFNATYERKHANLCFPHYPLKFPLLFLPLVPIFPQSLPSNFILYNYLSAVGDCSFVAQLPRLE